MNVLILSNMKPNANNPMYGVFVNNQFEALKNTGQFEQIEYLGIEDSGKGRFALIAKYLGLFFSVLFKAVFKAKRFDIVHVHYYFPTIIYAIIYKLLRNWKAKIIVTYHGSDVQLQQTPGGLYKKASNWVEHHIFVSQGLSDTYYKRVPDANKTILSAGILDLYLPDQTAEKEFDLIMVGSLTHLKGLDRLLPLLDAIKTPLKVGIIGQGPFEAQVKAYNSDVHHLTFLGRCNPQGICKYVNQSRFLLSLSRHESFGLVMTEAMACGVPVIATKTNGSKAQVKIGENGYLLENIESLDEFVTQSAEQVEGYLQGDGEAYAKLSDKSIECAEPHRLGRIIEGLLGLYQKF